MTGPVPSSSANPVTSRAFTRPEGLLDVDDARPVEEELVVLRRLVARRFRRGDDRQPLLHVGELHLERLAGEGHVLLRRRDVAREPKEEVRARDVGERIAEADVAPVDLLLQSGNHEMQKYNTGVAGYKLEGVGSITERIGDIASQGLFLGGSKIVNS